MSFSISPPSLKVICNLRREKKILSRRIIAIVGTRKRVRKSKRTGVRESPKKKQEPGKVR